jgi:hypothetical protein
MKFPSFDEIMNPNKNEDKDGKEKKESLRDSSEARVQANPDDFIELEDSPEDTETISMVQDDDGSDASFQIAGDDSPHPANEHKANDVLDSLPSVSSLNNEETASALEDAGNDGVEVSNNYDNVSAIDVLDMSSRENLKNPQFGDADGAAINVGDVDDDDEEAFVLVGENKSKKDILKNTIQTIVTLIIIVILFAIGYFATTMKFVKGNVVGASTEFAGYSAVSRAYQPNVDEIQKGQEVLVKDSRNLDWSPVPTSYQRLKVTDRDGVVFTGTDKAGVETKFPSTDIIYVLE